MNIPSDFYVKFWLKNSSLAIATGLVLGLLTRIWFLFFIFPIVAFIIYQIAIFRYFWGKERGNFEYYYREWLIKSHKIEINQTLYEGLLQNKQRNTSNEHGFFLYLKASEIATKEYDYDNAIQFLRQAVSSKPYDLVANYRLATALERVGDADNAISAYEAAKQDPSIKSPELKEFISNQIERVKTKGPTKKPPMSGLKYMTW